MARTGRFITFEGGEGAGKSTQARRLADSLAADCVPVLLTREPGGSPGAEILRQMLLNGSHEFASEAEIILHFASRAEHIARMIRPALAAGITVICDRYYDSTLVYQGHGQGGDRHAIAVLSALMGLVPDLTLVLDVSVATTQARLLARGQAADRYERLGVPFFTRIRDGFLAVAADNPARCVLVSGDADADTLMATLGGIVDRRFPR
ncbi:MAG: dTMP kinase [Acetobacteraceae bacterium]|nr:dTMP kinase [Acetobacteraceae bacterium]